MLVSEIPALRRYWYPVAYADEIGFEPVVTTPEQFADRIKTDIPRLGRIVREAHIRPE